MKLSEMCEIKMGQSPESSTYNEEGNGLPFFQGNADFGKIHPSVRVWCSSPVKIALPNDILISVRAPIGALNIADTKCCIGRGLAALTVNESVCNAGYLWYALQSKVNELNAKGTGSTFKAINKAALADTEIPYVPLDEQKKIADIFDKLSFAIDKRDRQIEILNLLVKSRFVEMFGESDLSYQKPEWSEIRSIGTVVGGSTPKTAVEEYWDGDRKWITPAELQSDTGYLYDSVRKITKLGAESCSLQLLPKDTVILTSRAPIGKVAIAGTEFYCNQGFKNIICNDTIIPRYLYSLLLFNVNYLNSLGRGATFKEISKSIVEKIRIPVPPIELQIQFADFVTKTDKSKYCICLSLKYLYTIHKILIGGYSNDQL